MILFPKTPLVEYIQLYESENMHFGCKDFDNFIPSNRNFVQFSILFSVTLKDTNCSQNYTLSVFTKDFVKTIITNYTENLLK